MNHKEKRRYPRIKEKLPVALLNKAGSAAIGITENLCPAGMKLICSREMAQILHPDGVIINHEHTELLHAQLLLPGSKKNKYFGVVCDLIYLALTPDSKEVVLGLEFVEFQGDSEQQLEDHISYCIRPDVP